MVYSGRVRFIRLLVLLALLAAPFGRMAAAEAMTMPHHPAMTMAAGHCDTMPASDSGDFDRSIDCMIACAMMAHAEAPALQPPPAASAPVSVLRAGLAGLHPEADPPPPRIS